MSFLRSMFSKEILILVCSVFLSVNIVHANGNHGGAVTTADSQQSPEQQIQQNASDGLNNVSGQQNSGVSDNSKSALETAVIGIGVSLGMAKVFENQCKANSTTCAVTLPIAAQYVMQAIEDKGSADHNLRTCVETGGCTPNIDTACGIACDPASIDTLNEFGVGPEDLTVDAPTALERLSLKAPPGSLSSGQLDSLKKGEVPKAEGSAGAGGAAAVAQSLGIGEDIANIQSKAKNLMIQSRHKALNGGSKSALKGGYSNPVPGGGVDSLGDKFKFKPLKKFTFGLPFNKQKEVGGLSRTVAGGDSIGVAAGNIFTTIKERYEDEANIEQMFDQKIDPNSPY